MGNVLNKIKCVLSKIKYVVYFCVFFVFIVKTLGCSNAFDPDNLWHIKMGSDIIHNKVIISENTYSWIRGTFWNQQEWLYDVILYCVTSIFGVIGYYLMSAIVKVGLMLVSFRYNKNKCDVHYPIICFIFSGLLLILFPHTGMNRPVEYSTFMFPVFIWLYDKYNYKYLLMYFICGLFMGNFHCGTVIVLTVTLVIQIVLDLLCELLLKCRTNNVTITYCIYRILSVLCFLAGSCINPLGPKQLYNMYKATHLATIKFISEWDSWSMSYYSMIVLFLVCVLSLGYALYSFKSKIDIQRIGLLCAYLVLALYSKKSVLIFVYCFVIFGYRYLDKMVYDLLSNIRDFIHNQKFIFLLRKLSIKLSKTFMLSVSIFSVFFYGVLYSYGSYQTFANYIQTNQDIVVSQSIVDYLKDNNGEHLLHGYTFSNYLLWNDIKVFVDTRQHPYVKEYGYATSFDDLMDIMHTKNIDTIDEYFDKYEFTEVLCDASFDINWYMSQRDDFSLIIEDEDTECKLWVKK